MRGAGLIVVAVVLVAGTVLGLWRRRVDGRLRPGPAAAPSAVPPSALAAGPSSARAPSAGSSSPALPSSPLAQPPAPASDPGGERVDPAVLAALGVPAAPATLLQFSTAFCAPCRAVRRVSAEVAALLPGVRHVEVDAESHLDEVRALGIWRTPTLLVLDADGRVIKRATGVPTKPHLIAAVADLLPPAENLHHDGP